jgi:ATP-binding cassette subfamily B protein
VRHERRAAASIAAFEHAASRAFGQIVQPRLRIARLVPEAGIPLVLAVAGFNVILGALPVAFVAATSVMLGRVPAAITAGIGSPAWRSALTAFAISAALFVVQQVLVPVQAALGELVARRVDGRVFGRLMAASLRSDGVGPLEDQGLLNELSEASQELEFGAYSPGRACTGLLNLIARYVQLTGYIVMVGVAFSWLAAGCLLAVVLMFRHGQRGGLRRYAQVFPTIAAFRRKSRYLRELAVGAPAAKEIRVFGLMDWLRLRYRDAYMAWLMPVWTARRRFMMRPFFWFTGFGVVAVAGMVAVVGVAGARSLSLAGLSLILQATVAALRLGEYYSESDTETQFGMNAFDAVRRYELDIARWEAGVATTRGGFEALPAQPAEISFENVTFRYPGRVEPLFAGLDLVVASGRCTAIVGVNGAGKTTLVKLLARLYEPEGGRIALGGVDIRSFATDAWRAQIAVVFQDFNRYEASAADNIGFGSVERLGDRSGIVAAARAAGILPTLEGLPRGLETMLARHATDGVELSGGQWQRVALARTLFALHCGASILVLDEPTAHLDVRAEARFFDEFIELTRGVTTILISHRFSTVRHADHIVVIEDGRVLEQGAHADLLRCGGRYEELFRLQADRFIDAGRADVGR